MIFRPRGRGLVLALTALALSSLESGLALAHSRLQRAEPPAESRLKSPPSEVKLTFTERLEPSYSGIQVKDERGARSIAETPMSTPRIRCFCGRPSGRSR